MGVRGRDGRQIFFTVSEIRLFLPLASPQLPYPFAPHRLLPRFLQRGRFVSEST